MVESYCSERKVIMEIIDIEIPTLDEMDIMSLDELNEWKIALAPFYADRFEISERYDFEQYKKAIRFLWFNRMIENIMAGVNRWERVAKYPKS